MRAERINNEELWNFAPVPQMSKGDEYRGKGKGVNEYCGTWEQRSCQLLKLLRRKIRQRDEGNAREIIDEDGLARLEGLNGVIGRLTI